MTFDTPRAKEKIHAIYQFTLKEKKSAYDVANEICINRKSAYFYLKHMADIGLLKEISSPNNIYFYIAITGAALPQVQAEEDVEAKREAQDKRKLQQKLSQIKPWRDELLFILFNTTPSPKE